MDQARTLAERIARKVSAGSQQPPPKTQLNAEIEAVRASIGELQQRLVQLESQARQEPRTSTRQADFVPPTHSPWLAGVNAAPHPSVERFGVEEAVINELVDYFQSEKPCSLDPSG